MKKEDARIGMPVRLINHPSYKSGSDTIIIGISTTQNRCILSSIIVRATNKLWTCNRTIAYIKDIYKKENIKNEYWSYHNTMLMCNFGDLEPA